MPIRILLEVRSGIQERELLVFLSDWFEPTLAALMGRVQDTRNSSGNAIAITSIHDESRFVQEFCTLLDGLKGHSIRGDIILFLKNESVKIC